MEDTPLGRVVSIRSESDPDVIRRFTPTRNGSGRSGRGTEIRPRPVTRWLCSGRWRRFAERRLAGHEHVSRSGIP